MSSWDKGTSRDTNRKARSGKCRSNYSWCISLLLFRCLPRFHSQGWDIDGYLAADHQGTIRMKSRSLSAIQELVSWVLLRSRSDIPGGKYPNYIYCFRIRAEESCPCPISGRRVFDQNWYNIALFCIIWRSLSIGGFESHIFSCRSFTFCRVSFMI